MDYEISKTPFKRFLLVREDGHVVISDPKKDKVEGVLRTIEALKFKKVLQPLGE